MDLAISIFASASVSGVLVFLTKSWISERLSNSIRHEYDQKIELFKAVLKSEHDTQLEKLRSQLAMAATEHQVRFANQYDQMAKVLADTYRQTTQMYSAAANYIKPVETEADGPQSERREKLNQALREFSDYFYEKRIYLPSDTAERVEGFRNKIYDVANEFSMKVEGPKGKFGDYEPMAWSKAWNSITEEIKPLRAELEQDFRTLLGVTSRR